VGLGGPRNAGLFAVQILATSDAALADSLVQYKQKIAEQVAAKNGAFQAKLDKRNA
jgi:phosphoribosylcarboxyaminoimidazole (NCAIR) mutase